MRSEAILRSALEQRQAVLRRLTALDGQQWDLVCPAPGPPPDVVRLDEPHRTVREVVAHLLVIDEMILRGGSLRYLGGRRDLDHPGSWDLRRVGPLAAAPPAELISLLAERGRRFSRVLESAPAPLRRVPIKGPFGRQPLGELITRRVLHEWLHEQDVAAATSPGEPSTAGAAVCAAIADAVLQSLPGEILPRTGLDTGVVRLVVEFGEGPDGEMRRSTWGLDFAQRRYGPRVVTPSDTTIRLHAMTLALLAHGRSDRLGSESCVAIVGDLDLAGALLTALGAPRTPASCLGLERLATTAS